jgi:uncharacterized membrane protein YvbJ
MLKVNVAGKDLYRCPACGKEQAEYAASCPRCGAGQTPQANRPDMKAILEQQDRAKT